MRCLSPARPMCCRITQAQFWAPAAAAAGVSLVMAYLNGVAVPNLLSLRTLVAKFVGTCCSVGANMTLGPEAPMVHLGACAAHVTTHAACGVARTQGLDCVELADETLIVWYA